MGAWAWLLYLAVLAVIAVVLKRLFGRGGEAPAKEGTAVKQDCASCSAVAGKCLQECAMEAAVADIEYFDDEELDRFRGRQSDGYTDEEAAEFAQGLAPEPPPALRQSARPAQGRGLYAGRGIGLAWLMA